MRIIVNGKDVNTDHREVSYKEILDYAGLKGNSRVSYRTRKTSGVLFRGERVKIEDNMVFNAGGE